MNALNQGSFGPPLRSGLHPPQAPAACPHLTVRDDGALLWRGVYMGRGEAATLAVEFHLSPYSDPPFRQWSAAIWQALKETEQ